METIKVNLATFEYQNKRFAYPFLIGALLLVLILSAYSIHRGIINHSEINEYEKRITQLEDRSLTGQKSNSTKRPELTSRDIESIKENAEFINRLIDMDTFPWDKLLDSLELMVPSDITLSSFSMSDDLDKVHLQGIARSIDDIGKFINKLNESDIYRDNTLISLSVSEEDTATGASGGKLDILFEMESKIGEKVKAES